MYVQAAGAPTGAPAGPGQRAAMTGYFSWRLGRFERAPAAEHSVYDICTPTASESVRPACTPAGVGPMSYVLEWIGAGTAMGTLVVLCCPSFALIALVVLLLIAATVLVAVAAAIAASPYLLARYLHGRWRTRSAARHSHGLHPPLTPFTERK
jgi:hypothetical protein